MIDSRLAPAQREMVSAWDRFWFCSEPGAASLQVVRIGLSLIAVFSEAAWAEYCTAEATSPIANARIAALSSAVFPLR